MAKSLREEYDIWRLRNDVIAEYNSEGAEDSYDGYYYVGLGSNENFLDTTNDEHVLILAELLGFDLEKYRFHD